MKKKKQKFGDKFVVKFENKEFPEYLVNKTTLPILNGNNQLKMRLYDITDNYFITDLISYYQKETKFNFDIAYY